MSEVLDLWLSRERPDSTSGKLQQAGARLAFSKAERSQLSGIILSLKYLDALRVTGVRTDSLNSHFMDSAKLV